MTMKHTQGPWIVNSFGCIHQQGKESAFIPLISPWAESAFDSTDEIAVANAHLIAAAPDLLESAKLLIDSYDICRKDRTPDVIFERLRAAIAKATGEK